MDKEEEEVEMTSPAMLIETFCEITSSSRVEASFFLESHNFDLDAAVSAFLDSNNNDDDDVAASHPILPPTLIPSPSAESPSLSQSPPARSRSPYRLRSGDQSKKKKTKKNEVASSSRTGGIRTLADLNKRPAAGVDDSDDDSDDDDYEDADEDEDESPQEYYTGGQKSGMLVQDPTKSNNDVDAIFNQARQAGALEGSTGSHHPSQISKSFTGTGRLLTGESVSVAPQQPESVNHDIIFWRNGFTIDNGPLRRINDPANASFLESIRKSECPKELEPADRSIPVHVNLTRRDENYNEPEKPYVPFHGTGRTLGSTSSSAIEEPTTTISTTANTAPSPSMGLVVDGNLPSTSIQIRLADGTRMVSRFNYHHTVNDIRAFIDASRPGGARNYELQMMGFPPKKLIDPNQTIEQVGLASSVVLQKF